MHVLSPRAGTTDIDGRRGGGGRGRGERGEGVEDIRGYLIHLGFERFLQPRLNQELI